MESDQIRIAALEDAVRELRAQLEELQRERTPSLRFGLRCYACGGERVLHIRQVLEGTYGKSVPLSLGATESMWSGHKPGDPLEVFVCRGCGLVEWYASGFSKLEVDGKSIVELVREVPTPTDPYR